MRLRKLLLLVSLLGSCCWAQSKAEYEQCVNPTDPDTQIRACSAFIQSGKYSNHYLSAIFNYRGNGYSNKGDLKHAIQDYDQAIRSNPKNADAVFNRGVAYGRKGDNKHAIQDYKEALRLNPADTRAQEALGKLTAASKP
jgi:tetratricopeptide (TPR) repeat protein